MLQKASDDRAALPQPLIVQEQGVTPTHTQLDHLLLATATVQTTATVSRCPCRMKNQMRFTLYFYFVQ